MIHTENSNTMCVQPWAIVSVFFMMLAYRLSLSIVVVIRDPFADSGHDMFKLDSLMASSEQTMIASLWGGLFRPVHVPWQPQHFCQQCRQGWWQRGAGSAVKITAVSPLGGPRCHCVATNPPPLRKAFIRRVGFGCTFSSYASTLPYHAMGVLPSTQPVATLGSSLPYHRGKFYFLFVQ